MRIKVHAKKQGIPQFTFGKRYYLAYAGATIADEFVFTRKNMIEMCNTDSETGKKLSSYRMSKRKLKELVNSPYIHFIAELEDQK